MASRIRHILHEREYPGRSHDGGQTGSTQSFSPLIMGILNVTPDSFSDGGDYFDPECAVSRTMDMIEEGADIIDVGPESTRPGSLPVPEDEQIKRAIPVIRTIRQANKRIPISIDTRLAPVAAAALESGADMINDTSALRDDPNMVEVVTDSDAYLVLMHRRGSPMDMQSGGGPQYADVIGEICGFLRERIDFAVSHGIDQSRIIVDPGIGFGKRIEHNLLILRDLRHFTALGQPVLVGASRKRFIEAVLGTNDPKMREIGSLVCAVHTALSGAAIVRVHDVRETVESFRMLRAIGDSAGARK